MPARLAMRRVEGDREWAGVLEAGPAAHLLQSPGWGEFKANYGWSPERWAWHDPDGNILAAAQVLRRWWPGRRRRWLSILYCPRGPALDWADEPTARVALRDLAGLAAAPRTVMVKLEPDVAAASGVENLLKASGWTPSTQAVQFSSTMVLDLRRSEDELLAAMKPKTRYNIRLAARRGVVVRAGESHADLDRLVDLYAETSVRDGFVIRPREYYLRAWSDFITAGLARPFLAEIEGQAVAGLIVFRWGRGAWYLYGMSSAAHREAMPNHALQWAAIQWARDAGCTTYDFWGAPETADPSDPLWGLYRFKEGFGARHVRLVGSWDYTERPRLYRLYSNVLPRILAWTRRRQEEQTRRTVDPAA